MKARYKQDLVNIQPMEAGHEQELVNIQKIKARNKQDLVNVARRFFACKQLLQRQNRKGLLYRIVKD